MFLTSNPCAIKNIQAVGAAWQVAPPAQRWPLQYAGPPLFDAGTEAAALLDGRNPQPCTPGVLAALLVEKRLIAGVVRGRTEFGPRALGHRSLLAWPADSGVKDDLNVLKHRQFWRPCAPMVLQEDALRVFTSLPRYVLTDGRQPYTSVQQTGLK